MSLIIHSYPTKTDHPEINKHPITALSRPAPRSGWGVSLRRVPLRLGEGSKRKQESNAGSRLGETPLAWASCLLAQKFEWVAWLTFRANWCGEPLSDSLRRVRLAWARLTVLALISPAAHVYSNPNKHIRYSMHQKQWFHHTTSSKLKNRPEIWSRFGKIDTIWFFLLNFLKQDMNFSSRLKLLIRMVCFVSVINIILVSIFDEKFIICFKKFNEKVQIASIFKKLWLNCINFHKSVLVSRSGMFERADKNQEEGELGS